MAETTGAPRDLIGFLDYYFVKKAPFQIPQAGREAIVQFGPWIVVVLLVLSLPALLFLLGLGAWAPFGGYRWGYSDAVGWAYAYWPWMIGAIVRFVLMAMALPGLFARKMSGWTLVFYAELVSLVTGVLAMNLVGALIGALIAFYILFQIRPLYK
jgi:hypothetical protein